MKNKMTLTEFRKRWEPRTRGGHKYRIHAIDLSGPFPVLITVKTYVGWLISNTTLEGIWWGRIPKHEWDLIRKRKKRGKSAGRRS